MAPKAPVGSLSKKPLRAAGVSFLGKCKVKQLAFEFHNKKTCRDCGQEKSLNQFDKHSAGRDGFSRRCKECRRIYIRQWYAKNHDRINAYHRQWRADNPENSIEYSRRWREENPEYFKELGRERRKDPTFCEKQRERNRRYYAEHKEEHAERRRKWRRENPEKNRAIQARRRARDIGAEGDYTAEEFIALCEQHDNRCLCCGKKKPLTIDHIVPLSKGGSNSIDNIQPLCQPCNSRKGVQITDYR